MHLNTASPRRTLTMPVNINLQGARRRQARHRDLHMAAAQEQEWSRGMDGHGEQRARTQMPASSLGEDRAILLGFAMIAFSGLMFFVVGITMVKPYVNRECEDPGLVTLNLSWLLFTSNWEKEEAGCVLMQANILKDWVDCRGVSTVPCLRVTVNLTGFNQSAFLHFDEESVLLTSECFYIPKCQMDRTNLQAEAQRVKMTLDTQVGSSSSCFTDRMRHPKDVILNRKYTLRKALLALLWPCVMLGGGALLVAFVKLTQCLAILSSEMCSETAGGRMTSRYTQGKLYRLLRRSSMHSPS